MKVFTYILSLLMTTAYFFRGGSVSMLDYGWADWVSGQVERVWDLMDISLLRSAVNGVDPAYKR